MFALNQPHQSSTNSKNRIKVFQRQNRLSVTKRPFTAHPTTNRSLGRITVVSPKHGSSTVRPKSGNQRNFYSNDVINRERSASKSDFRDEEKLNYVDKNEELFNSSNYDSGNESLETLNFGTLMAELDSEIKTSRCKSRIEMISSASDSYRLTNLSRPSTKTNQSFKRIQSAPIRTSSRNSSNGSRSHSRPPSGLAIIQNRVAENTAHRNSSVPSARPSSVASGVSFGEDFENVSTSRSGKTMGSASMYSQSLSAGATALKGGILEGVKPCKRMESVLSEDLAAIVSELSRQCCDVLGPKLCMECIKNVKRFNNFITFHKRHPDIDESAMTLYAIPLIQRMYPNLHKSEIKNKLSSGEISQQLKLKINRSKDIEFFDEKLTDYLPEKYRRSRIRKQRLEAGKGVTKVGDELHVLPFNPYYYSDQRVSNRKKYRRCALFPTDFMASGMSTPSEVGTISRASTPEQLLPSPESELEENEEEIDFGECEPTMMDLTWARDFPRFYAGVDQRYTMPVWRRSDLPPDP